MCNLRTRSCGVSCLPPCISSSTAPSPSWQPGTHRQHRAPHPALVGRSSSPSGAEPGAWLASLGSFGCAGTRSGRRRKHMLN
eukprot:716365-Rhodomonas_salina.1